MFVLDSWILTSGELSWWSKQMALLEILEKNLFSTDSEISVRNVLEAMKRSVWFRIVWCLDLFKSWSLVWPLVGIAQVESNCILDDNYFFPQCIQSLKHRVLCRSILVIRQKAQPLNFFLEAETVKYFWKWCYKKFWQKWKHDLCGKKAGLVTLNIPGWPANVWLGRGRVIRVG